MEIRVKFLPGKQKLFLQQIQEKSDLNINQLAQIAGVVPRSYRDWKREKFAMSLKAVRLFIKKFKIPLPEKLETITQRWKNYKIISAKKGGIARFKKHGSPATLEGRKKGGRKALKILREKGIIPGFKIYNFPTRFTDDLAEYVGILLGDGGITPGQVFVTLNSEADIDYAKFVSSLETKLFGSSPKLLFRKDCKAVVIYLNGIGLVSYLKTIGLKVGNKIRQQVDVPSWIKSSKSYKIACLRGLMDTDGGVFLHKYKVNNKSYIYKKICFTNRSLPLLYFVDKALEDLNFTPKIITKVVNKKVWLYNKDEVERYLSFIGTHNSRLLKYQ